MADKLTQRELKRLENSSLKNTASRKTGTRSRFDRRYRPLTSHFPSSARRTLQPDAISLVPASLELYSVGTNHHDTKVLSFALVWINTESLTRRVRRETPSRALRPGSRSMNDRKSE